MKKIISLLIVIAIVVGGFYISIMPKDLVVNAEEYYIKKIEYNGEEITDKFLLDAIAEEVKEYKRESLSTQEIEELKIITKIEEWINNQGKQETQEEESVQPQAEIKISGPVSETKPTILLWQDMAVCYWSTSQGMYEIVDGDILYSEVVKLVEEFQK